MKVILFGATGMVGQGVLRECLLDRRVETVLAIGRSSTGQHHEKLREIVRGDLLNLTPIEADLRGFDACFYCLGVSSVGMKEDLYRRLTYDLLEFLSRHVSGDWGDLCDDDRRENDLSVMEGFRILSAYRLPRTGVKLWIITEADRSATTFLLPSEY